MSLYSDPRQSLLFNDSKFTKSNKSFPWWHLVAESWTFTRLPFPFLVYFRPQIYATPVKPLRLLVDLTIHLEAWFDNFTAFIFLTSEVGPDVLSLTVHFSLSSELVTLCALLHIIYQKEKCQHTLLQELQYCIYLHSQSEWPPNRLRRYVCFGGLIS